MSNEGAIVERGGFRVRVEGDRVRDDTGRGDARERERRWAERVGLDREEDGGNVVEAGLSASAA